ncbi:MAG TPA: hypothetical protein VMS21_10845, partial [Methylomirabilota bacterium]|nr:hypothetical protein [Methylomirabilota bacterium]
MPCLAAAQSETGAFEQWDSYRQKIQHRSVIDAFGREFLRVESMPRPVVPARGVNGSESVVKVHRSELAKEIAELRGSLEESIAVPAGFVAPILDDAGDVERLSALEGVASVEDEGLRA